MCNISAVTPAVVNNTTTAVPFDNVLFFRGSGNPANFRFIIPTAGFWRVETSITFQTSTASQRIIGTIRLNGANRGEATACKTNFPGGVFVSSTFPRAVGNTIDATILHQAGSDMQLRCGYSSYICVTFVGYALS